MIRVILTALILLSGTIARAEIPVQEVRSQGGIDAWLVEDTTIPLVALSLHFEGGALLDPNGKEGVTEMMVSLMDEGAGNLDAIAYAERLEALPMRFSLSAGRTGISLSATILKSDLENCIRFLAMTLSKPRFAEEDITRIRPQILSGLKSRETDPNAIAGIAFRRTLFGDHPFAREVEGSLETVTGLTRDDIVTAHGDTFDPTKVIAAAVGDITAEELGDILDTLVAGLAPTQTDATHAVEPSAEGGLQVIDFDSSQSIAFFGHEGFTRQDPDYLAGYLANFILGGWSSQARLGQELREERGLTYGVNTLMRSNELGPLVIGSISTAHDRMGEALDVIRDEWARMAETGVTLSELKEAKRYLIGSYALGFDSNGKIAGTLVSLQRAGLPPEFMRNRNALIESLTVDEVNRAAERLFRPEALTIVVVGQPTGLPED